MHESEFFVRNRAALREVFPGTAPIVLTANGLLQRSGDTTFPFRQDSNFWYFTGITEPDIVLVIDKDKEYLIVPGRDGAREAFEGVIDIDGLKAVSGIDTVIDEKTGWKQLGVRLKRVQHVATLSPAKSYIANHGIYTNPSRRRLVSKIKEHNSTIELLDLRPHASLLRMVKRPEELEAIRAAVAVTEKSLKNIRKRLGSFWYEYEIEASITKDFRSQNVTHAYQPIIAADQNACTLHYTANNAALHDKSLVLIDVGAELGHYAADLTRTYCLNPTKRQLQVWTAVLEVRKFAMDLLKPGVLTREYEAKIELFMGEKLRELGLIKTIEKETVRKYYPHSTSHYLGLDVHDVGDYERPLEAGVVLTVEPGIYIPEEGIGIRIEDDVLITKNGIDILSKSLPLDL